DVGDRPACGGNDEPRPPAPQADSHRSPPSTWPILHQTRGRSKGRPFRDLPTVRYHGGSAAPGVVQVSVRDGHLSGPPGTRRTRPALRAIAAAGSPMATAPSVEPALT